MRLISTLTKVCNMKKTTIVILMHDIALKLIIIDVASSDLLQLMAHARTD